MSRPFSRSLGALEAGGRRGGMLPLLAGLGLLVGWAAWLLLGRVVVEVGSERARIEVAGSVRPVDAPADGRIVSSHLALGRRVAPGDVLVELESGPERLLLDEERTRRDGLESRLLALRAEAAAEQEALGHAVAALDASVAEARARRTEAEAVGARADDASRRLVRLREAGLATDAELERARLDAEASRAAGVAAREASRRAEHERAQATQDRRARLEAIGGEIARLEGEAATSLAAEAREGAELARREVRATLAGRVVEDRGLAVGAFVEAGDRLGAIVPDGRLHVVAWVLPGAALGRVRPGQAARVRLDGFPWMEHGSVAGRVATVATEPDGANVRVELDIEDGRGLPLEHGLTGRVEIAVESASPGRLLLRAAGALLAPPRGTPEPEADPNAAERR